MTAFSTKEERIESIPRSVEANAQEYLPQPRGGSSLAIELQARAFVFTVNGCSADDRFIQSNCQRDPFGAALVAVAHDEHA